MMKQVVTIVFLSCIAFFFYGKTNGQELRCNVVVDASQIQETKQVAEKQIFEDMQKSLSEFMNTTRWTNDKFTPEERINCNLLITINKVPAIGVFEATAQIQSSRPVYGSSYESILFSFVDRNWHFQYVQSQPLTFSENVFTNNLTALLGFYAYVMIGLDYDSFGRLGGSAYLQKALNLANTAAQDNSSGPGWKAFEDTKNRYALAENLNNQQMQPFREGLYIYHRQGMDTFLTNPEQARAQILGVLNSIKQVTQVKPNAVLINAFFDTKSTELTNIFSEGAPQDKSQAYNLLVELDPTKTDRYKKILK